MRKFFAIILAGIMMFALATPAMADTATTMLMEPNTGQLTLNEGDAGQISYIAFDLGVNENIVVESQNSAVVTVRSYQATYCIIDAVSAGTANIWIYVHDENDNEVSGSKSIVTVTVNASTQATPVDSINATVTAELGQSVYDVVPTFTATPEDSVEFFSDFLTWYRVPEGVDPSTCSKEQVEDLAAGAVFESGYTYVAVLCFGVKTGYTLDEDNSKLYINSSATYSLPDNENTISGIYTVTMPGAAGPKTYTVSLNNQGQGSALDSLEVTEGGKIVKPADPTADGYAFGGWFKDAACTTAWDFDVDTVSADTVLYAKWDIINVITPVPNPTPAMGDSNMTLVYAVIAVIACFAFGFVMGRRKATR